ncbi:unnamed protein product [Effrenium voratum]|nr:unnamed protein product [Effrenium voratum]
MGSGITSTQLQHVSGQCSNSFTAKWMPASANLQIATSCFTGKRDDKMVARPAVVQHQLGNVEASLLQLGCDVAIGSVGIPVAMCFENAQVRLFCTVALSACPWPTK